MNFYFKHISKFFNIQFYTIKEKRGKKNSVAVDFVVISGKGVEFHFVMLEACESGISIPWTTDRIVDK